MVAAMGTDTWAGIVRVSHMGGRKSGAEDFHSERDQVQAMTEAVAKVGGQLHVLPAELDVSGGTPLTKRPSLLKAVQGVEDGTYGGIVVAYHSRLGRDIEQEEAVWRRVEAAGGQILMALDGIDTSTADGRTFRRFRSVMNQGEREKHTERFEGLREGATAAGIWQRRQTPTGYDRDPATRRLIPNQDARVVHQAFVQRAAGQPLVEIADQLRMTPSGARHLLRNRVYLGELTVGAHTNPAAHPAIVTVDEFEAAQLQVPRPGRGPRSAPALLARLVRCAGCGHVMSRGSGGGREVYTCAGRHSAGTCPERAAITLHRLDAYVTEVALQHLERLDVDSTQLNVDLDSARSELAHAEQELAAYLDAVSAADIGAEAFAAGAASRRGKIINARSELQRLIALKPATPIHGDIRAAWDQLDAHERNTLLRGLFETVVVQRVGRGRSLPVSERTRVVVTGAGLVTDYRSAERGLPIISLWPDSDDVRVIGVLSGQDPLKRPRSVRQRSVE